MRQNVMKRQENLQSCTDETEKMKESASQFQTNAKQLKEKVKKRKFFEDLLMFYFSVQDEEMVSALNSLNE